MLLWTAFVWTTLASNVVRTASNANEMTLQPDRACAALSEQNFVQQIGTSLCPVIATVIEHMITILKAHEHLNPWTGSDVM
eukprot:scaffold214256_cov15-Tisochrysis_lutea.AAC.1